MRLTTPDTCRFFPLDKEQDDERWNKAHHANAARVLRTTIQLRGFWVKIGQYLSSRGDVMPEPWIEHLSVLQVVCNSTASVSKTCIKDEVPPSPMADIEDQIMAGFGQPLSELFSSFDANPLGTASIAQVGSAMLGIG